VLGGGVESPGLDRYSVSRLSSLVFWSWYFGFGVSFVLVFRVRYFGFGFRV